MDSRSPRRAPPACGQPPPGVAPGRSPTFWARHDRHQRLASGRWVPCAADVNPVRRCSRVRPRTSASG